MKHGQALLYMSHMILQYSDIIGTCLFIMLKIFFHMIYDIPKSWHIWHRIVCIRVDGMALQHLNMIIHLHLPTFAHPFPKY